MFAPALALLRPMAKISPHCCPFLEAVKAATRTLTADVKASGRVLRCLKFLTQIMANAKTSEEAYSAIVKVGGLEALGVHLSLCAAILENTSMTKRVKGED